MSGRKMPGRRRCSTPDVPSRAASARAGPCRRRVSVSTRHRRHRSRGGARREVGVGRAVGSVRRMDYAGVIAQESARTADALAQAPLTAQVPSCPDWSAADLAYHLGEVQDFWSQIVGNAPAGPDDARRHGAPARRRAGPVPAHAHAGAAGRARRARPGGPVLVLVVRRAGPSAGCCAARRTRRWCTGSTPSRPRGCRSPIPGPRSRPTGSTRCSGSWSAGCRRGPRSRPTASGSGCSPRTPTGSGSWRSAGSTARPRPPARSTTRSARSSSAVRPGRGRTRTSPRRSPGRPGTWSCGSGGAASADGLTVDGDQAAVDRLRAVIVESTQ